MPYIASWCGVLGRLVIGGRSDDTFSGSHGARTANDEVHLPASERSHYPPPHATLLTYWAAVAPWRASPLPPPCIPQRSRCSRCCCYPRSRASRVSGDWLTRADWPTSCRGFQIIQPAAADWPFILRAASSCSSRGLDCSVQRPACQSCQHTLFLSISTWGQMCSLLPYYLDRSRYAAACDKTRRLTGLYSHT